MKSYGSTPAALPQYTVKRNEILSRTERDLLQVDRPGYGSHNKLEVAFNLVNATVGAGIIGLPFAIYNAGFVFGIVVSILVAIVSQLGLYMLIAAGQRVGVYKFAGLVEYLMGRPGYHLLNIIMLVQTLGVCVSYFILLGDTLPMLLTLYFPQYQFLQNRPLVVAAISLILVFPLNLPRSIGALARWSIVSVLCIPVIIIILLIRAPSYVPEPYDIPITTLGPNVFGALGILAFAFACPHVAFNNFLSQADQTSRGWASSTIIATTMSWSVSILFAVVGYLCFGPNLEPNVFRNFPADDNIVNIGRFALGFSMILTIPMAFLPTREAVQKLLGFETHTRQPTATQHYAVTAVLFLIIMYIGITVQSLGKVYALVGGFAATTLAYIIPAAAYLFTSTNRLGRRSKGKEPATPATPSTIDDEETLLNQEEEVDAIISLEEQPVCWWLVAAACFLIVWGFIVMFLAAFSVFSSS